MLQVEIRLQAAFAESTSKYKEDGGCGRAGAEVMNAHMDRDATERGGRENGRERDREIDREIEREREGGREREREREREKGRTRPRRR